MGKYIYISINVIKNNFHLVWGLMANFLKWISSLNTSFAQISRHKINGNNIHMLINYFNL